MSKILIVEDESAIGEFIAKGMQSAGFSTTAVDTGGAGITAAVNGSFDLMILDLGLPDMDGFEVLRHIRAAGAKLPVIILTARSSATDTVAGLEGGADDYMPKPFSFDELLARVKLRLKAASSEVVVLTRGELSLDVRTRKATVGNRSVELTAREFALAEAFLRNPGVVLSRERLLKDVWGYTFDPGSNVVEVYVRYLRRKIGAKYFLTVRGQGYRLA